MPIVLTDHEIREIVDLAPPTLRRRLESALADSAVPRTQHILDIAREFARDGELEIDDQNAVVSEGEDNGAYVLAWMWVDFADTDLDKCCAEHLEINCARCAVSTLPAGEMGK